MNGSAKRPRQESDRAAARFRPIVAAVLVVASIGLLLGCVLVFPGYLVASDVNHVSLPASELATARNAVRTTLLQGLGGIVLLLGAYLTWRQIQVGREAGRAELQLGREAQITERFVQAVDQLGSEKLAVRIGGIHALARIARNSDPDRGAIMELLAAFVRTNAPWPPVHDSPYPANLLVTKVPHLPVRAPDIQEALTTLAQRGPLPPPVSGWWTVNLMGTDLRRAWLASANLRRVGLRSACLIRASLHGADLRGAELWGVDFQQADLTAAIADLTTRWPEGFDPEAAGVRTVGLEGSDLRGCELHLVDLTGVSLKGARANAATTWPPGFDWKTAGVIMDDTSDIRT
jgi:hypothetical protein